MKPAPFKYIRPDSVDEALETLREYGSDAKVLAGGQSLGAMLNLRLARPSVIVDVGRLDELRYVRKEKNELVIGAGVTQAELMSRTSLADEVPMLAMALPHVGHFQTRNRGTVCGSLCHADPSAELPLCLATLDGTVTVAGPRGRRTVAAASFQAGMLTTSLEPDELVIEARFPMAKKSARYAFREVARRHGDFAIVAIAAIRNGSSVTLGIGGVADRPHLSSWPELSQAGLDDKLNTLAWSLDPGSDIHASARYRRELVRRQGRSAILETEIDRD